MASSRPSGWASIAESQGHEVTVLTSRKRTDDGPLNMPASSFDGRLVDLDYPFAKSLGYGGPGIFGKVKKRIQRALWSWRAAYWLMRDPTLRRQHVVITTYSPSSVLFLGWWSTILHRDVFWTADYRDLWTDNAYKPHGRLQHRILVGIQRLILKRARLITTVSEPLRDSLQKLVPSKPARVVYNGFENNVKDNSPPEVIVGNGSKPKTILYTGTIYVGKRNPRPLLSRFRELIDEGKLDESAIRLRFLGDRLGDLPGQLQEYGLEKQVQRLGSVGLLESLDAQRNADLLLMLGSNDPGILTGKLFEYLGARRPILALGDEPDSAVGQVLTETGTGLAVGTDASQIERVLSCLARDEPLWFFQPDESSISQYSRENQGRHLLELIHDGIGLGGELDSHSAVSP